MRALHLTSLLSLLALAGTETAFAQSPEPTQEQKLTSTELTPPEVLEQVDPIYPEQALAEKRSGEVILQLDIDEQGHVVAANVARGAGAGMDEAAQQAALLMKFVPAKRGDKAVKSRILYKMNFTLRVPEEAPGAPVQPNAALPHRPGKFRGIVKLDAGDVPCAGASVELQLSDARTLRTTTDASGAFEFGDIPEGKLLVQIVSPGYEPLRSDENLGQGEELEIKYRLHPNDGAIEVTVKGERQDREVTRRTVERQELAVIPGTSGDALKVIESMPGVGRTPAFSGMIVVRGSSPYGTQTFIDGTYVPQIYHFGGLSSVVPTEMIESIDFYPGNFSSKYGRATGGIIDVKLREIDHDGKYHGLAQVDLIDARVMLRGPVPLLKGWSFNLGGRRSHIDTWIGAVAGNSVGFKTAPVYYDWQAFAETKPTPRSVFRVGLFGAEDRLQMVLKDAIEDAPEIGNSFKGEIRTARLQAIYRNQFSDRLRLDTTAAIGLDREMSRAGAISSVNMDYVPITLRGDLSYRLSDKFLVRAGPDIIVYHYDADVLSVRPPEPGEIEGDHTMRPMLRYKGKGYFSGPAAFAELEWTPTSRAKFLFGSRLDYFSVNERWDFNPRFNARYDIHQGAHRTTLKTGLGVYSERPQITQVIVPYGTPGIKSNRSIHSSIGIEQVVTPEVDVSVEAFHKYLDNLVVAAQFADGSSGFANTGTGYVYGTETMIRWKPGGRFFGWVAYTLSRSVRQNSSSEAQHIFDFDQTHNLTVLGSYDLGRGWRVGGKFRFVSGNPYTACQGGTLNGASGNYECIQGAYNAGRTPGFHQLDARVDKTWTFSAWKLTAYLDVQNTYNRANPDGISYNYRYTKPEWRTGLPIIPSLGVRGEF